MDTYYSPLAGLWIRQDDLGVGLNYISFSSVLQIYDLSVDALSPTFYFLLPSSKIRDVTFLFNEEGKNIIVIMSSAGYIYTQLMEEASSAQQGPFYVTNVLEINHEDLKVRADVDFSSSSSISSIVFLFSSVSDFSPISRNSCPLGPN